MNKKYYVDKQEMYDEIVKSKEAGQCSNRLAEMFYAIAEKYSHHRYFRDYERRYGRMFKEDMISAGIMACMKAWYKFDHEKFDNPFAFFTTCIYRAFCGYLSKEYDYSNTKNALKIDQGMRGDYGYEEMIKTGEVEDEEEYKTKLGIVEEAEEIESGTPAPEDTDQPAANEPAPGKRTTAEHLKGITLWGEPEVKPVEEESLTVDTVDDMFAIHR